jgi:hypothetical protein
MNPIRRARRIADVLTGLAFAWLALAVAAPAPFAEAAQPLGGGTAPAAPEARVHAVVVGGMAG